MKVVCDNCRAVYKVPDAKLVKPVNKATCRQCGHRMLIPKPKPGADPEERTLVTAVPPTPAGVGRRDQGDPPTTPIDDVPEATMPAVLEEDAARPTWDNQHDEVQGFPGTPLPARQRAGDTLPAPSSLEQPLPAADPRMTQTPPVIIRQEAPPSHDPAGDLTWAILTTLGALFGSFLLPFVHVSNNQWITGAVMGLGLALAFGGGIVTLLILVTGQRGRRKANVILSIGIGGLLGSIFAAFVTPGLLITQAVLTDEINFASPTNPAEPVAVATGTPEPVAEDAGADAEDMVA